MGTCLYADIGCVGGVSSGLQPSRESQVWSHNFNSCVKSHLLWPIKKKSSQDKIFSTRATDRYDIH